MVSFSSTNRLLHRTLKKASIRLQNAPKTSILHLSRWISNILSSRMHEFPSISASDRIDKTGKYTLTKRCASNLLSLFLSLVRNSLQLLPVSPPWQHVYSTKTCLSLRFLCTFRFMSKQRRIEFAKFDLECHIVDSLVIYSPMRSRCEKSVLWHFSLSYEMIWNDICIQTSCVHFCSLHACIDAYRYS